MACKPLKFDDITRDQFRAIRARINARADTILNAGDSGSADGDGVTATWTYSESERTLTIQCVDKLWYFSEGYVANKIRDIVEADL